jgi:hypothetical protein
MGARALQKKEKEKAEKKKKKEKKKKQNENKGRGFDTRSSSEGPLVAAKQSAAKDKKGGKRHIKSSSFSGLLGSTDYASPYYSPLPAPGLVFPRCFHVAPTLFPRCFHVVSTLFPRCCHARALKRTIFRLG